MKTDCGGTFRILFQMPYAVELDGMRVAQCIQSFVRKTYYPNYIHRTSFSELVVIPRLIPAFFI